MNKRICFIYTETTGLHKTNSSVCKKKLFEFARLVKLNYQIVEIIGSDVIQNKIVKQVVKPRNMFIPESTVQFHGITQEYAIIHGIDPSILIKEFVQDIKLVDILVTHNIDFHLKTILAEAVRYNIPINLSKHVIIDTNNFNYNSLISESNTIQYVKLKDLAHELKIKNIEKSNENNLELITSVFFKLYSKYKKSLREN
jgi:DNA polymerase III epsilon subunit-like protein